MSQLLVFDEAGGLPKELTIAEWLGSWLPEYLLDVRMALRCIGKGDVPARMQEADEPEIVECKAKQ